MSASSISARSCLDTEPWCARATSAGAPAAAPAWAMISAGIRPFQALEPRAPAAETPASARSAASSFSRPHSRSASRREFANTIVDLCCSIRSSTRSSTCGQIDRAGAGPAPESPSEPERPGAVSSSVMSSTGTTTASSMRLGLGGCTTVTGRAPPRNAATSATGRTVADSPTRWAGRAAPRSASSRSSDSARCAPRLFPATACTSSTMTVSTPRSVSLACEVSSRNSDSGVVMRMSGGWLTSFLRSSAAVSPVRTATLMSGSASPSRCAACRIPVSGARRFRSMSTASALSGEIYSTRVRCFGSCGGTAASRSIAHRNAASVLPDPVGATTRASSPLPMARQAPAWACVGSANAPSNQARVAGENPSSAPVSGDSSVMLPYCPAPPTFPAAPARTRA